MRLVLGLSGAASDAEIQAAYWTLRAHIEARAAASDDAGFIAARAAELQRLTEQLALALGIEPDALPAPHLEPARPAPDRVWVKRLGIAAAAAGVIALIVVLVARERPTTTPHASALAAVASDAPTGRLVFTEGEFPNRYTVLDAAGQSVVRTGVTSVGSVDLAPGEYAVWLAGLACEASRQHSVLIESEGEVEIAGPDCLRSVELVVRSDMSGDVLRIDGEAVGETGPEPHPLAVGAHEIEVEVPGRPPWRAQVEIGEDERITLHAKLATAAANGNEAPEAARPPAASEPPAPRGPTAKTGVAPRPKPELGGAAPGGSPQRGVPGGTSTGEIARDGRGGSRSWHEGVRRRLVAKYDSNGSESLDGTVEIASIPCTEWRAIESQYEAGGLQVPMTRLYGFDGSDWVEGALGIEQGLRDFSYRRMRECGLK